MDYIIYADINNETTDSTSGLLATVSSSSTQNNEDYFCFCES